MINMLKEMCKNENYFDNLNEENDHYHPVELRERKNIALLYEKSETKEWIQQNILECDFIYQKMIKDKKRRIFFILDKENKIIRPLVLDLNHLINSMKQFKNKFINCYTCRRRTKDCKNKLKNPNLNI